MNRISKHFAWRHILACHGNEALLNFSGGALTVISIVVLDRYDNVKVTQAM